MSLVKLEHRRRREAQVFARYLLDVECPPAVVSSYVRFAELHPARLIGEGDWFDRLLMTMGRRRGLLPLADAYAALFRPSTTLRKRLVMCLALLECLPDIDRKLQCIEPVSRLRLWGETAVLVLKQSTTWIVAIPLLAPADVLARMSHSRNRLSRP